MAAAAESVDRPERTNRAIALHAKVWKALKLRAVAEEQKIPDLLESILCRELGVSDLTPTPRKSARRKPAARAAVA